MKKSVLKTGLCLLLVLTLFSTCAFADLIAEPGDEFYRRNRQDCRHLGALYSAMGPEGCVIFYKSPKNSQTAFRLENGKSIYIDFIYEDANGVVWGVAEQYSGGTYKTGWAPMDYLWEDYSSDLFISQYSESIRSEERKLETENGDGTINLWSYPGSESCYELSFDAYDLEFNRIFTDEQGREWGYVGYFYGNRDKWVLLDDPGASFEEVYPDGAPDYDKRVKPTAENNTAAGENTITPDSGADSRTLLICGIAVVAVVIVTGALLIGLKKRR